MCMLKLCHITSCVTSQFFLWQANFLIACERGSDSYIGDIYCFSFFSGKFLTFVRTQIYCLWYDFWFFFKFSSFLLLKGRQTPLSRSKSVSATKNVIDLYFRKLNLIIEFPSEIKILRFDPVFSNWVNLIFKIFLINC